jgi:hypothetical protein
VWHAHLAAAGGVALQVRGVLGNAGANKYLTRRKQ